MRKLLPSFALLGFVLTAGVAHGGQVWTDANGDGTPDPFPFRSVLSSVVTIDLWIDSQSFTFTSYNIWAEWSPGLTPIGGGTNLITGCSNDPNDTFSHPHGMGFAGSVCNPAKHGVIRIASFQLRITGVPSNVHPIIDAANTYNVFSLLSSPSGYLLFQTASGSNFISDGDFATDRKSWGAIKGLYR